MRTLRTAAVAAGLILAAISAGWSQTPRAADVASTWAEINFEGARVAQVRLVASSANPKKGILLAGVEIAMAEGWKTYWRSPGDAGVPPSFDWAGSTNKGAIKVRYPAPTRMPEAGGQVIAYKGSVLFPVEVSPREPAEPVVLKLAIEFGVCREICIPATANLSVEIAPGPVGAIHREIAAALDRVPRPQQNRRGGDPELKRVTVSREGPAPHLMIEVAAANEGADVFVEAPEGLYVPMPKKLSHDGGGIIRYASDLSHDLLRDLRGKTLTLTLVSKTGASEAQWTFP